MPIESHSLIIRTPFAENSRFFRDATRGLPRTPGVYIMRDSLGHPVYVGKAKNLRRRVGSYFTPSASGDAKVSKLLSVLSGLYYAETDSELEALLLESRLVKLWLPMFNRDLRQPESTCFLRVDLRDPLPVIRAVRFRREDGALYIGPFRGTSRVAEALEAVNGVYKLPQCAEQTRLKPKERGCTYHAFGRCLGPCTERIDVDEYHRQVRMAWNSLSGRSDDAIRKLIARRTEVVEQFRFEEAYRVQNRIRALEAIGCGCLSAPSGLGGRFITVVPSESPARPVVLMISNGKLVARFVCGSPDEPTEDQLNRMLRCLDHPTRDLLPSRPSSDDLLIVHSYLRRNRLERYILPYPSDSLVPAIRSAVKGIRRTRRQIDAASPHGP